MALELRNVSKIYIEDSSIKIVGKEWVEYKTVMAIFLMVISRKVFWLGNLMRV